MTGLHQAMTKFYEDLPTLLSSVPKADKLIVLGDFNTRVETGCAVWRRVRLEHRPAADKNSSVESLWCRLWDADHSTALGVLGRARRQHEDWFDENDVDMSNLAAERNRLSRAYLNRQTDANRWDINKCTHLAQQQLRELYGAWDARQAQEIQLIKERPKWHQGDIRPPDQRNCAASRL
ncbi:hypothetical protein SprV_0501810000 [Sparganum proliferum]